MIYHSTIICLIVFFPFIAFGQENRDSTHKVSLHEVIVSANKVEETTRSVAQQVNVISSSQIKRSSNATLAEVLQSSGAVSVQKSQQGGGSPVIRGFEANKILLVIDGVRMNNLIYRAGHLQNIITVDQYSLEKTEILYGPSSTVYGSDALGGVIHMITRSPRFATGQTGLLTTGNSFIHYAAANHEKTGHSDFIIGGKRFSSYTSLTYSDFEDLRMGTRKGIIDSVFGKRYYYVEQINGKDSIVLNDDPYLQKFSGYRQYYLVQKFAFKQRDNIIHSLNLQRSNTNNIPRYDRSTLPGPDKFDYAEWYYGPQLRSLAAYQVSIHSMPGFFNRLNAGINYQYSEESRHQRKFNSLNLDNRFEKVNSIGYTVTLQKITATHNLRLGTEGRIERLKSTAFRETINTHEKQPLDTRYPDGKNSMQFYALYATHTWKVTDKWILNDGLRFQTTHLYSEFVSRDFFPFPFTESSQRNSALTGSIGINFLPESDWKISTLISTGFRVPNVDNTGKVFDSQPGVLIVPNPNLKPEKTYNADFSIIKIFFEKIKWENTVFYTFYRNAIVLDRFQFSGNDSVFYDGEMSGVFASQNKRKAFITGFSSSLFAEITSSFSFRGTLSYTYGRIQTDSSNIPLDHIPPVFGHAQLSYTRAPLQVDFSCDFNGWKKISDYLPNSEDNEKYATPDGMPGWYIFNLSTSYNLNKNWQIQAGCNNIMDTQYRLFASGINSAGRNIFVTVRFQW